jgi:hypothetical protein
MTEEKKKKRDPKGPVTKGDHVLWFNAVIIASVLCRNSRRMAVLLGVDTQCPRDRTATHCVTVIGYAPSSNIRVSPVNLVLGFTCFELVRNGPRRAADITCFTLATVN